MMIKRIKAAETEKLKIFQEPVKGVFFPFSLFNYSIYNTADFLFEPADYFISHDNVFIV